MTEKKDPPSSVVGHRPMPLLIIVSGPPGSGKSTLARRIAQELRLPLVAKDDIKESLFDSLGWQDREWSKQLGRATYELMYYFAGIQLAAGKSLIVESNFNENATPKFRVLQAKYDFVPFQILCYANANVLWERFTARWNSSHRHPGHVDGKISEDEFPEICRVNSQSLDIGGTVIEIDTNNFGEIDYEGLYANLRKVQERLNEAP